MEDNDRKILIKFLGEAWHEVKGQTKSHGNKWICSCHSTSGDGYWQKEDLIKHINKENSRTFHSWDDFGKLRDKIVEKEGWNWFVIFAIKEFQKEHPVLKSEEGGGWYRFEPEFLQWFIDEDRFPELILEAIKEGILK